MKILYIDTTESTKTVVTITQEGKRNSYVEKTTLEKKSQNVLSLIEKALAQENLSLKDITSIEVREGPGSFTGTRVGIAVANTLGWTLQVPVNGKKIATALYASSKYDEPHVEN